MIFSPLSVNVKIKMTELNNLSASGLNFSSPYQVETPCGTPSPPNAASTQARPPPKPRRFPNVNVNDFLPRDLEGMINNLSLVSKQPNNS